MSFGLNAYSLRNHMQTEEDFLTLALALKGAGYSYLQFSGSPLGAESIRRVSEKSGLPVVLTHMPMERILHDTDALMEEHARYNCKNIGLGMMPVETILDEHKCKETILMLDERAAYLKEHGYKFFYHHHHFEFYRMGRETVLDFMLKNAPHIHITADTYWLQYGGGDILRCLERMKGRIECVHLKDYKIANRDGKLVPEFAPLGEGVLDFPAIIDKMKVLGVQYFLVEQDNAAQHENGIEEVIRSANYLKEKIGL